MTVRRSAALVRVRIKVAIATARRADGANKPSACRVHFSELPARQLAGAFLGSRCPDHCKISELTGRKRPRADASRWQNFFQSELMTERRKTVGQLRSRPSLLSGCYRINHLSRNFRIWSKDVPITVRYSARLPLSPAIFSMLLLCQAKYSFVRFSPSSPDGISARTVIK